MTPIYLQFIPNSITAAISSLYMCIYMITRQRSQRQIFTPMASSLPCSWRLTAADTDQPDLGLAWLYALAVLCFFVLDRWA